MPDLRPGDRRVREHGNQEGSDVLRGAGSLGHDRTRLEGNVPQHLAEIIEQAQGVIARVRRHGALQRRDGKEGQERDEIGVEINVTAHDEKGGRLSEGGTGCARRAEAIDDRVLKVGVGVS